MYILRSVVGMNAVGGIVVSRFFFLSLDRSIRRANGASRVVHHADARGRAGREKEKGGEGREGSPKGRGCGVGG